MVYEIIICLKGRIFSDGFTDKLQELSEDIFPERFVTLDESRHYGDYISLEVQTEENLEEVIISARKRLKEKGYNPTKLIIEAEDVSVLEQKNTKEQYSNI